MAFSVPDLSYAFDALEPHIDARTMEIHHDKHHAAYVTNLNAALEGTDWADKPIDEVLQNLDSIPEDKRMAVRNNGGGHANHTLFWEIMGPGGGGDPSGALGDAITETFGSVADLKAAVNDAGVKRFGSGWTWLVCGRKRPRREVHAEPGHARHGGRDADPRHRRVGARLLPELPEPPPRLPRGVVERRRLERRRGEVRRRARVAPAQSASVASA